MLGSSGKFDPELPWLVGYCFQVAHAIYCLLRPMNLGLRPYFL